MEIDVLYCGICHSDLSMIDNEWGMSQYPLVAGHEVIGTVTGIGSQVKNLKLGMTVGLGWHCGYCGHCHSSINQRPHPFRQASVIRALLHYRQER